MLVFARRWFTGTNVFAPFLIDFNVSSAVFVTVWMRCLYQVLITVFRAEWHIQQTVEADSSSLSACFCAEEASTHNARTMYGGGGGCGRGRVFTGVSSHTNWCFDAKMGRESSCCYSDGENNKKQILLWEETSISTKWWIRNWEKHFFPSLFADPVSFQDHLASFFSIMLLCKLILKKII